MGKPRRKCEGNAMVLLPVETVDWPLLRRQKAALAGLMSMRKVESKERQAIEGILELLEELQDRAERVLGKHAVFGDK